MDPDHLHFNEWAFMAETDPEVFERRREQCINEWLSKCGKHRPQLEALQSKIDAERKRATSPQEAVAAISAMMCASLCDLAGELKCLSDDLKSLEGQRAGVDAMEEAKRVLKAAQAKTAPLPTG